MSRQSLPHEFGELEGKLASDEAGVSELQELYERIEGTYTRAAIAMSGAETIQVSDSTTAMIPYAHLGPSTPRA